MYWKPVGYFTRWVAFLSQDHGVTYLGNWCNDDTKLISKQELDPAIAYNPMFVNLLNRACSSTGKAHLDGNTGALTLHPLMSNDSGYWEHLISRTLAENTQEYSFLEVYGKY